MTFDELLERLEGMGRVRGTSAAIGVTDAEAARYARVLEYGSIARQAPWPTPGPRTVLAVDPETGAQVVVSAQAPQGFIRARIPEFLDAIRARLAQPVDWLEAGGAEAHLHESVGEAATEALESLRQAVPRDSGKLAQSLTLVSP